MSKTYKDQEQLNFMESLCVEGLIFYHAVDECYPVVYKEYSSRGEAQSHSRTVESMLRWHGFTEEEVSVDYYDEYIDVYLDLTLFTNSNIQRVMNLLKVVM